VIEIDCRRRASARRRRRPLRIRHTSSSYALRRLASPPRTWSPACLRLTAPRPTCPRSWPRGRDGSLGRRSSKWRAHAPARRL